MKMLENENVSITNVLTVAPVPIFTPSVSTALTSSEIQ